jgi:hypothetical protein
MRECSHCQRKFTPKDLVKEDSKEMEAERKARGLEGVRFLYYTCPDCGYADIFVDIRHLPDESDEDLHSRRAELEAAVREIHAEKVDVVVTEKA